METIEIVLVESAHMDLKADTILSVPSLSDPQ